MADTELPYDKQRDILVGLAIFHAHGGDSVCAEHDQFYASQADDQPLSDDEINLLHAHGWFHDPCDGCADDANPGDIAPQGDEEGRHLRTCTEWSIFT